KAVAFGLDTRRWSQTSVSESGGESSVHRRQTREHASSLKLFSLCTPNQPTVAGGRIVGRKRSTRIVSLSWYFNTVLRKCAIVSLALATLDLRLSSAVADAWRKPRFSRISQGLRQLTHIRSHTGAACPCFASGTGDDLSRYPHLGEQVVHRLREDHGR